MKITVCCITRNRPHLLKYMIRCFEQQDYPNRELIILDDTGNLRPVENKAERWRIVVEDERYPTLGAKRNAVARMAPDDTDAMVVWDDDDLYLPWGLTATAAALEHVDWSRPSVSLLLTPRGLWQHLTYARKDGKDKACHCCWGVRTEAFWGVGGFDDSRNCGEDLILAVSLLEMGVTEADPIGLGYRPWYIWGPHMNRHVSEPGVDYDKLNKGRAADSGIIYPQDPPQIDLAHPVFLPGVSPRPWQSDWFTEV